MWIILHHYFPFFLCNSFVDCSYGTSLSSGQSLIHKSKRGKVLFSDLKFGNQPMQRVARLVWHSTLFKSLLSTIKRWPVPARTWGKDSINHFVHLLLTNWNKLTKEPIETWELQHYSDIIRQWTNNLTRNPSFFIFFRFSNASTFSWDECTLNDRFLFLNVKKINKRDSDSMEYSLALLLSTKDVRNGCQN